MTQDYFIRNHSFRLLRDPAEDVLAGKRVINGHLPQGFDLLPVKYEWALEKYAAMTANHWEPEDIQMQRDVEQWRSENITAGERWIIMMGIGYFSAAEGIVGDNIQHVVQDLVFAAELKLVLGRHAHEENIHADSLLYMISSLGINPHECEAMFEQIPSIVKKNRFVTRHSENLRRDVELNSIAGKQLLAKNMFVFGQCMEGTQFFGLFGMVLSLYRQGKFPGIGQMFRYTLRDESNHIEVFRRLFIDLLKENLEICTSAFRDELVEIMQEAVALEKEFIRDCLPLNAVGLTLAEFERYIDFIADRRLRGCGLPELCPGISNPLPWLDEVILTRKEQNFFEGKVTDYQKVAGLMTEIFKAENLEEKESTQAEQNLWPPCTGAPRAAAPGTDTQPFQGVMDMPNSASGAATTYQIGGRQFVLDKSKAEAAFAAKKVVNGRETMTFNLLPLKYGWAYNLYKEMKAAHWGPLSPDIQMHNDIAQWQAADLRAEERTLVRLAVGWLAAARTMEGAGLQHTMRTLVTAPEIKLVLGRDTHDDNIRQETLLHIVNSLGMNIHECEALYRASPLIAKKNAFMARHTRGLRPGLDLKQTENLVLLARCLFVFGQCFKGLHLFGLWGTLMNLQPEEKLPGVRKLFSNLLRDDAHQTEVMRRLLLNLLAENPSIQTGNLTVELSAIMQEAAALEKEYIRLELPNQDLGLEKTDLECFIDYTASCRLKNCGLPVPGQGMPNPLPGLPPLLHLLENASLHTGSQTLEDCPDEDF